MAVYVFIFHSEGEANEHVEQTFSSDEEALEFATHLSEHCDIDLWAGDRLVAKLKMRGQ
jgi:hypothetical protein